MLELEIVALQDLLWKWPIERVGAQPQVQVCQEFRDQTPPKATVAWLSDTTVNPGEPNREGSREEPQLGSRWPKLRFLVTKAKDLQPRCAALSKKIVCCLVEPGCISVWPVYPHPPAPSPK